VAGVMLFARLGELPLRDPDEGRNSEVAREMMLRHAWITPTYNGLAYLDKPSFFFKTVGISMALFGESEFAARLPSALFACGILAMVFSFCRREYDDTTAALAILVIATTPLFIALGRHVIFDMTLAFFVCAAIFAGYFAEASEGARRRNLYLLGAALCGGGTLVKGPVGFILPALVLGIFNAIEKKTGWWKRLFHPLNFLVFFAITLPWFFALSHERPDFPHYGLVEESFNRFTKPSFNRKAPFYYFGLVILGGLFAWSVLLPEAMRAAWKSRQRWSRADRLLIVWSIAVVIFFSISKSKLPHYILTAAVALGILVARIFRKALAERDGLAARIVLRALIFLAVLSICAGAFLIVNIVNPQAHETIFKIRSKEFDRVALVFPTAAAMLILIAVAALAGRILRDVRIALAAFLILPLSIVSFAFPGLARYSEASSSREVVRHIPKDVDVACLQSWPNGLLFYLKRPVTIISANGAELTSNYIIYTLKKTEHWPPQMVPVAEQEHWLATRANPVYMIANDRMKASLEALAAARHGAIEPLGPGWWGALLSPSK
jgi:4-amino-4-deoxy-L-arabinose transferase-like glycosyltransferase